MQSQTESNINSLGEGLYARAFASAIRPAPRLTVSQWAEQHRQLPAGLTAESGPWRTERTPYLREIMDCLSVNSPYERVVFMKGSQIGATECGNNWIGYVIHHAPGAMMLVMPNLELAKRNSKQRIAPLIESSPVLRERVRETRSRDSGNTILVKEFSRGILIMAGAESGSGLRSTPARYLFLDEVDAYGPTDEGDPVNLAIARTRTFGRRKKIFMTSTPLIAGVSRIEEAFLSGDQRRYWVPCPNCNEFQILQFAHLKWPKGKPDETVYICEHCSGEIRNHQKHWMLPRGEWRASATGDGKTATFHLSSLYTPVGWDPAWPEIAAQWERAQKDTLLLQDVVNHIFGETWKIEGEAPDWEILFNRREDYRKGTVPAGGLFLTAGADVHPDRIEIQIVAWGRWKESWLVDYVVLRGNTALSGPQSIWEELTKLVANQKYKHASGNMLPIRGLCIDCKYETQMVYQWVRTQDYRRVLAVHGQGRGPEILGRPNAVDINLSGRIIRRGAEVWPVDSGRLKSELYALLKLDKPEEGEQFPAGYCHFYNDLDDEFFKQLTAEQVTKRVKRGYVKLEWENTRSGKRNEALDTRVYARAAATHFGIDRMNEGHWRNMESRLAPAPEVQQQQPRPPQRPSGPRIIGRFLL